MRKPYNIKSSDEYIKTFSDFERCNKYRSEIIDSSNIPPVCFFADGRKSSSLKWTKVVGKVTEYTDFPDDEPVKRFERHDIYTCDEIGIEVDLTVTEYPNFPVIEYLPVIKNISDHNSPVITEVKAIDEALIEDCNMVELHRNGGDNFNNGKSFTSRLNEYAPYSDLMAYAGGKTGVTLSCRLGFPTVHSLPNFNIEDGEHEHGVIAVLSWAGSWQADFVITHDRHVRLRAGQIDTEFVLRPDESVRAPMMVLLFYTGDYLCGQNIWRHWYFRHNVLRQHGKRMRSNLLYCISSDTNGMLNTCEENIESVNNAVRLGINDLIDYINQDAGWYDEKPGTHWGWTGNWYPSPTRYPDGLKPVADLSHENSMLYSVWFEPERVVKGTKTHRDLGKGAIIPVIDNGKFRNAECDDEIADGDNLLANYADPAVVEYISSTITKIIKENGIDQYRQDENINTLWHYWVGNDNTESKELGIPRTGITEAKFIAGYHRMWDILLEKNPGLLIDACSSGGRRNDLETVRKSFIHTRSDDYSSAENAQEQTYGMSMWYMLMGTAMLYEADSYDRRSRLAASIGFLPHDEEWVPIFRSAVEKWKGYMKVFFSNYYPLTPISENPEATLSMQYDNIDTGMGIIPIYFRKEGSITVYPTGLTADSDYELWNEDTPDDIISVSGKKLMEEGITAVTDQKYAFMYHYRRVN